MGSDLTRCGSSGALDKGRIGQDMENMVFGEIKCMPYQECQKDTLSSVRTSGMGMGTPLERCLGEVGVAIWT